MQKILGVLTVIMFFSSCIPQYSETKFYEFVVENNLTHNEVKIVPLTKTDFWITDDESFIVLPGEHIIIGSEIRYDHNRVIKDIFKPDEAIESFDVYIDNIKQTTDYTRRSLWSFTIGPVDESGTYKLTID